MKTKARLLLMCVLLSGPALAQESCEQMQKRIEGQMLAKKVKPFALTTVDKSDSSIGSAKVVGHCARGTKVIVFRTIAPETAAAGK